MATIIPRLIDDSEIIIRFAFEGDYKRKKPCTEENLNGREVFFDNRYEFYPVSVIRKLYLNASECINRGEKIQPGLKSLILFQKKDFDAAVEKNLLVRPDFKAVILGTPLDVNNEYIAEDVVVTNETEGNPAHADIKFINPGIIQADAENANTAIRSFSSILIKYCKIVTLSEEGEINEELFDSKFRNL